MVDGEDSERLTPLRLGFHAVGAEVAVDAGYGFHTLNGIRKLLHTSRPAIPQDPFKHQARISEVRLGGSRYTRAPSASTATSAPTA
jgi:hypothetical protein